MPSRPWLNLTTGFNPIVHFASGTTVVGSSGSGPGTINVTGEFYVLFFDNTQTVSNDTINLGNSTDLAELSGYDTTGAGNQILTLASSVTVDVVGNADIEGGDSWGDGIVNQGTIDQKGSGSSLYILPDTFANSGAIDAEAANGSLLIYPITFTNSGTINVANGEAATIEPTVTGTGTDTISGDSTLEFDAGVSTAATLGDQDIDFTGAGALHLLKPASFYGEISGFAAGDTVELLGSWAFSGISQAAGMTTLTLVSGSTTHAFEFAGDYGQSNNFSITSGTTTKIAYV
jgi:hypothetical protein